MEIARAIGASFDPPREGLRQRKMGRGDHRPDAGGARWATALRGKYTLWLHERLACQLLDVAEVDLLALVVGDVEAVDDLDGLADVLRPTLRIERTVGGENDLVGAVELQAAYGRRAGAEHRRVGV